MSPHPIPQPCPHLSSGPGFRLRILSGMRTCMLTAASLVTALTLYPVSQVNAAVVYNEDFTGQLGKGAVGNGNASSPTVDTSGVDWTVDVSNSNMTGTGNDYFMVVDNGGNEVFEMLDPGGTSGVYWYSPVINVGYYYNLQVSAYVQAVGANFNTNPTDAFELYYSVNGGPDVLYFSADDYWDQGDATVNDNTPVGIFVSPVLPANANTVQITLRAVGNSGVQRIFMDDVQIIGQSPIPEPSSIGLISLGLIVFTSRRVMKRSQRG